MTREEVFDLLTYMAARDRRTVGKADVAAWFEDAGDLDYADAREAVRIHFRESTEWLVPAHIRRLVKSIRERRLANSDLAIPAADPADEATYRQALKDITRRLGNGKMPFRAIEGGRGKAAPSKAYRDARSAEDNERVLGQTIACPVEWCSALAGQPCVSQVHGKPLAKGHPSRIKAARSEAS